MLPNDLHVLVEQERRQDRLRQAERSRLIRAANKGRPARDWTLHLAVAGQIGCQLVRLGRKLQSYGAVPPHRRPAGDEVTRLQSSAR